MNATDEEIFVVTKLSYCDEFIKNMPDGYETLIGENGIRLLEGKNRDYLLQEQCLKIAKLYY